MIYINHNLRAIFIHIPKTGGSYIGPTLVEYYGFTCYLDVMSKKRLDHNLICKSSNTKTGIEIYDNTFLNQTIGILTYCRSSDYLNNKMNMDEEKWNTYNKFCFIRHPYDRLLSGWNHIKKIFNYKMQLIDYILQEPTNVSDIEYAHIFFEQQKHIEYNGICGVNIIGRFEYLEQDFVKILKTIGINSIIHKSKKVNVSRPEKGDNIIMDINVIRRANEIFKNDFELFHYLQYNC